jgi:hypothetical protein
MLLGHLDTDGLVLRQRTALLKSLCRLALASPRPGAVNLISGLPTS